MQYVGITITLLIFLSPLLTFFFPPSYPHYLNIPPFLFLLFSSGPINAGTVALCLDCNSFIISRWKKYYIGWLPEFLHLLICNAPWASKERTCLYHFVKNTHQSLNNTLAVMSLCSSYHHLYKTTFLVKA